jgi:hypothetical protein
MAFATFPVKKIFWRTSTELISENDMLKHLNKEAQPVAMSRFPQIEPEPTALPPFPKAGTLQRIQSSTKDAVKGFKGALGVRGEKSGEVFPGAMVAKPTRQTSTKLRKVRTASDPATAAAVVVAPAGTTKVSSLRNKTSLEIGTAAISLPTNPRHIAGHRRVVNAPMEVQLLSQKVTVRAGLARA